MSNDEKRDIEDRINDAMAKIVMLSEVILSGGPWRSSIIPHPQPSVNTFLHLF